MSLKNKIQNALLNTIELLGIKWMNRTTGSAVVKDLGIHGDLVQVEGMEVMDYILNHNYIKDKTQLVESIGGSIYKEGCTYLKAMLPDELTGLVGAVPLKKYLNPEDKSYKLKDIQVHQGQHQLELIDTNRQNTQEKVDYVYLVLDMYSKEISKGNWSKKKEVISTWHPGKPMAYPSVPGISKDTPVKQVSPGAMTERIIPSQDDEDEDERILPPHNITRNPAANTEINRIRGQALWDEYALLHENYRTDATAERLLYLEKAVNILDTNKININKD